MKRYIAKVLLSLGLCQVALGGPSPIYQNYGVVTSPPVVDATSFYNAGDFTVNTVIKINTSISFGDATVLSGLFGYGNTSFPFMTKDTASWTNTSSGVMSGEPGFQFDTGTSTSRHSASFFYNAGVVQGVDGEADIFDALYVPVAATTASVISALGQPVSSQVLVLATNIVNTGAMSVGNAGLLSLTGNNVTNAYASLAAGFVSTVGQTNFLQDTTGLQGQDENVIIGVNGNYTYFFLPSPEVYDLFWGVTNALTVDVGGLSEDLPFGIPEVIDGDRGFLEFLPAIPANFDTAQFSVNAFFYNFGTNFYYNVVFVNTNFADAKLSATVGFSPEFGDLLFAGNIPIGLENAVEDIVQIAEPVYDVITGQIVTNGIYLIDGGAILPTMTLSANAGVPEGTAEGSTVPEGYSRPNSYELTTVTPPEWSDTFPGNIGYFPELVYTAGVFNNNLEPLETATYGAQIGHNPANLSGSFSSLANPDSEAFLNLEDLQVNLPDPTNEYARIQINAGNLDMTQSRLRAEGMVLLNATNLLGGGTSSVDFGEANAALGATNGSLIISNIFPTNFSRVRGDIYALSASWQNTQTNGVTNQWYYHVLVVDQNLYGTFPSTVRNLKLTGKKSIVLQDNLSVINQAVFNTTNLTINSSNYFSQNAANFTPATTPSLQNLFIGTNGFLGATSTLDIGFNLNQPQAGPAGRLYAVNSITNFGQMTATAPLLQSAIFENDGQITSANGGSIVIEADALGLGLALTNTTNFLLADGAVDLSAATIEATNSIISAGLTEQGSLTLYATKQLTDLVSGTPTTNTNSAIINHWTVTGGFSLPVKPAIGDLFGTEIHTIATNFQQAIHVWAGTDMGATPAGFVNNAVIGRLVLDRQSSDSVLHFSAAGAANAMYVDYLVLTNFAFSSYRTGLLIDQNFTIYFGGCNADPQKLMEVYPQLKWVQNFAGPNSTQVVPYIDSSIVCLMNSNLAESFEISSFNNGIPNFYNQPYVLNRPNVSNPTDPTNVLCCNAEGGVFGGIGWNSPSYASNYVNIDCPSNQLEVRSLLVATPAPGGGQTLNMLNISVNGQGSITPKLETSQVALGQSYSLTATPAKGWVFQHWSTFGLAGAVNTNSPILAFNFLSNTVITANFIANPFGALQGDYNGLFFESGGVNPGSSGAFSLKMASSGSFSGRLLMGPSTYNFSSQFSGAGAAQVQAKSGAKSLTLNLQLDMTGQTGQILGDVNGGAWDAPLSADIAPVWSSKIPSPLAGSYTMFLAWESGGDGYGAGTVSKQGVLTLAGALADGVSFSASAPVSQDGQWPFYAYAAAGKDSVLGWVSVGNGLTGTNVTWSKPSGKGPLYVAGFTNALQLAGSPWQPPARKSSALILANPVVTLSNGGLPEPLTTGVALQNYLSYTATNLTLNINASSGSFSGWFESPGSKRRQTVSGVVLQNTGSARGFFQGANESGAVLLQDQ
jgi:hypothetical protein